MLLIQDLALGPGTYTDLLTTACNSSSMGSWGLRMSSGISTGYTQTTQAHTLKKESQPEGSRTVDVVTACCSLATWVAELGGSLENSLSNTVVPCLIKQNSVRSKQ